MADWKVVADAVGDSVVQVVRVPARIAKGCGDAGAKYADNIDRRLEEIETQMPDRPDVLVRAPIGMIADTFGLVADVIEPAARALGDTAKGISAQVEKIRGR